MVEMYEQAHQSDRGFLSCKEWFTKGSAKLLHCSWSNLEALDRRLTETKELCEVEIK